MKRISSILALVLAVTITGCQRLFFKQKIVGSRISYSLHSLAFKGDTLRDIGLMEDTLVINYYKSDGESKGQNGAIEISTLGDSLFVNQFSYDFSGQMINVYNETQIMDPFFHSRQSRKLRQKNAFSKNVNMRNIFNLPQKLRSYRYAKGTTAPDFYLISWMHHTKIVRFEDGSANLKLYNIDNLLGF